MRAALALALVAAAACGPPTVPIGAINARLAEANCAWLVRCGTFDTMDRCMGYQRQLDPVTPSIAAAVAAGLVDYDGVQAAECVDEITAMSCSLADEGPRIRPSVTCRGILRAGRKIGDPCGLDAECASRNCSFQDCPANGCCTGVCVEADHEAGLAEDCVTSGYQCAPNLRCDAGLGVCVPLLPLGAPCIQLRDCDFGLTCLDTCQPQPRVGDPCGTLQGAPSCGVALGLSCDLASLTCQPRLGEGEPCDPDHDRCAGAYLDCDAISRRCTPLPAIGQPCDVRLRCTAGAFCAVLGEGGQTLCLPYIDDGSPCVGGGGCASGVCDFTTELCAEPPVCT